MPWEGKGNLRLAFRGITGNGNSRSPLIWAVCSVQCTILCKCNEKGKERAPLFVWGFPNTHNPEARSTSLHDSGSFQYLFFELYVCCADAFDVPPKINQRRRKWKEEIIVTEQQKKKARPWWLVQTNVNANADTVRNRRKRSIVEERMKGDINN